MARVEVVTDSASDLPVDIAHSDNLAIVPLTIRFGAVELRDRAELSIDEFWERCESQDSPPETSAPAPGDFREAFLAAADRGADGVVCVTMSSSLSATYQSALTAAADLGDRIRVEVIDSRSVTMGEGLIVDRALRVAREGGSLDAVAGAVADLIPRVRVRGTLDTLDYLRRGGRIGNAQALLGSLLAIKPTLVLHEGRVEPGQRQRTRGRALRQLVDEGRSEGLVERVAVFHAHARDIEDFLSLVKETWPGLDVVLSELGPVIGTHAGPGAIGLCLQLANPIS